MCDYCIGNKDVFADINIQCNVLINGNEMYVNMPNNTIHVPIVYCPMCGEQISEARDSHNSNTLRENLMRFNTSTENEKVANDRRTALDVAKYVVNTCIKIGHPVSNVCLQHVLYELYKEAFRNGCTLFYDEFEATEAGPRVSDVYYNFCAWGGMPITMEEKISDNPNKKVPEKFKNLFDVIVCSTANTSLYDWIEKARRCDSAWYKSYNNKSSYISGAAIHEEVVNAGDVYNEMLRNMQSKGLI